jgi:hypothetical protein
MNDVAAENARRGTPDWQLQRPATSRLSAAAQQITRNVLARFLAAGAGAA